MALFGKPQYSTVQGRKKDIPQDLYRKCPESGAIVYVKELEKNLWVVPSSNFHYPLDAPSRIKSLIDEGTFEEQDSNLNSTDPLNFKAKASYKDKLEQYQKKTSMKDAAINGIGKMGGIDVSLAVMDFRFLGASMGSVVGERITRCIEEGYEKEIPVIIVSSSGGARMYEGILSLMQMAKTSAALAKLSKKNIPFISILTNPTMAGVMASFASLGDIIIAEPKARIGFAGPRVIEETTRQKLPKGFQTSEFLLERGLLDQIVHRHEMKDRLISLLTSLLYSKNNK